MSYFAENCQINKNQHVFVMVITSQLVSDILQSSDVSNYQEPRLTQKGHHSDFLFDKKMFL